MGDHTLFASACFLLVGLTILAGLIFGGFLPAPPPDPPDDDCDWHQMPE